MSMGPACTAKDHDHVVTQRHENHSAFNGYHRTPSNWSEVRCLQTGNRWRTKAGYVAELRDATVEEDRNWHQTPQHLAYQREHGSTSMTIHHGPEGKTVEWSRDEAH